MVQKPDHGFWAVVFLGVLNLRQQAADNPNPVQWNTEIINVPDTVNLDTFAWNSNLL